MLELTKNGSAHFLRDSNTDMCHIFLVKVLYIVGERERGRERGSSDVLVTS